MYTLKDTFNDRPISRHRTLDAAVRADHAHSRAVKRHNGPNSYIPTAILDHDDDPIRDGHPEYERLAYLEYHTP